jgi:hypothetical protein
MVKDYEQFNTDTTDPLVPVVTGWHYAKATDTTPDRQHCYVRPSSVVSLTIARDGVEEVVTDAELRQAQLSRSDVKSALKRCHWSPGAGTSKSSTEALKPPTLNRPTAKF